MRSISTTRIDGAQRAQTLAAALTFCILILPACGRKNNRTARAPRVPSPAKTDTVRSNAPKPVSVPVGYTEQGVASWYGIPYHGRAAADGEIYNMETLVAAHRLMPFNTWLKVTNLQNNKTVDVRIIDRGPFVQGRIIDLSKAAARQIDLLGPGVGEVRLEVISAPVDMPVADFYAVQIGAFAMQENAERLRAQYAARFGDARVVMKQGSTPLWRVLVGKEPSAAAAQQLADVVSPGQKSVFVVRLDPAPPAPSTPAPLRTPSPVPAATPPMNAPVSAPAPSPSSPASGGANPASELPHLN